MALVVSKVLVQVVVNHLGREVDNRLDQAEDFRSDPVGANHLVRVVEDRSGQAVERASDLEEGNQWGLAVAAAWLPVEGCPCCPACLVRVTKPLQHDAVVCHPSHFCPGGAKGIWILNP
jgi:hypothetical protein